MHTSAKVRLTSIAIRIRIICSLARFQPSLEISFKVAKRQTDKQTNKQRRLHIILGAGNQRLVALSHNTCSRAVGTDTSNKMATFGFNQGWLAGRLGYFRLFVELRM